MPDVRLLDVDIEALIIAWAIASVDVQTTFGANPNTRVAGGLDPVDNTTLPAARIQLITGTVPVRDHLAAPVLEVNVWASTKAAARDGAALLRGRLHDPAVVKTHDLGIVTGYETAQHLRTLNDFDAPLLSRYIFATRYWAHPLPAA